MVLRLGGEEDDDKTLHDMNDMTTSLPVNRHRRAAPCVCDVDVGKGKATLWSRRAADATRRRIRDLQPASLRTHTSRLSNSSVSASASASASASLYPRWSIGRAVKHHPARPAYMGLPASLARLTRETRRSEQHPIYAPPTTTTTGIAATRI